ncbi:hypothetical protein WBJ53_06080 [Spirosoma sp. SC4-14]|uniref:hypothetical protein n=1 Tax=Spirosoma sp. SC4-14 TaxID=3128900 RepID=UPI0030CE636D
MQTIDNRIRAGLMLFWALYFSIVWLSNTADALKALSLLPANWPFASGNYTLIVRVVAIYQSPVWLSILFFAGVILWEGIGAFLFWKAFAAVFRQNPTQKISIHQAFGFTIGLWAAFILADEIFLAYMLGGISATHYNLLLAELASFILIRQGGFAQG